MRGGTCPLTPVTVLVYSVTMYTTCLRHKVRAGTEAVDDFDYEKDLLETAIRFKFRFKSQTYEQRAGERFRKSPKHFREEKVDKI